MKLIFQKNFLVLVQLEDSIINGYIDKLIDDTYELVGTLSGTMIIPDDITLEDFEYNFTSEIEEITSATGSILYRLKVGAFKTRKEAEALSSKLKQKQISCIIKQN